MARPSSPPRAARPVAFVSMSGGGFQSVGPYEWPGTARDKPLRAMQEALERRLRAGDSRILAARTGFFPGRPSNGDPVGLQHERIALGPLGPTREATAW